MDPIPIGTKLKDISPEENIPAPVVTITSLVGTAKPAQVISKMAFDVRKPARVLLAEVAAPLAPVKIDYELIKEEPIVEPIIEEPVEKP